MLRQKKHKVGRLLQNLIILSIIGSLFTTGGILLWASTLKIPDLKSFEQRKIAQSTKIYDRTGEVLLFDIHENVQRTVIPFDSMSRNIKNATVAIEDAEFYEHNGIKPKAVLRAVLTNLSQGKIYGQGGSTITQQVIKNSILTQEKKISRKLKEWVLSLKLERALNKEQILELYLNETPYGGNLYGIEEASKSFFDKSAAELTIAESAYMAALPQAPTYYSPYGNHQEDLESRKNLVLKQMLDNGFIPKKDYELARNETVVFKPQENTGIKAPHFVMFIREYLASKYGERAIEERGFRVITTLDYKLQEKAERIVAEYAEENINKFNASNASLVAIDPKTGQILTMVGSRNYFDETIDGNFNVALAHRQPGSAFKPFVYATAFKKGFTPETVVFDVQTQFSTTCPIDNLTVEGPCYAPGNYDTVFRGPVTFREALAQSINVPSVKVLYLAGLNDSLQTARSMGILSLADANQYGLTLVLGGGEVSLIDITSSYGVFANEGIRNPYTGILRIEDSNGVVVEEFSQHPLRVLPDQVALTISDILSDNEARAPAFGQRSFLYFGERDVAVKTGTTNDYRDAWIIGYSPNIAVGAWAGNNDNSPMEKKVAGFIIAPLWNAFMQEALATLPKERFRAPREMPLDQLNQLSPRLRGFWEGGESYIVDKISGKLATEFTPQELRDEKIITSVHSILFWIDKNKPQGPGLEKPELDPQFKAWEFAIEIWKKTQGIVDETSLTATTSSPIATPNIPTEYDDIHKPEFRPNITIISPTADRLYSKNEVITVNISNNSKFPLSKIDIFINERFVASIHKPPFSYNLLLNTVQTTIGNNTLKIIGYDSVLNKGESETTFVVID